MYLFVRCVRESLEHLVFYTDDFTINVYRILHYKRVRRITVLRRNQTAYGTICLVVDTINDVMFIDLIRVACDPETASATVSLHRPLCVNFHFSATHTLT